MAEVTPANSMVRQYLRVKWANLYIQVKVQFHFTVINETEIHEKYDFSKKLHIFA